MVLHCVQSRQWPEKNKQAWEYLVATGTSAHNQSINQSASHSGNPSVSQSVSQSINQSINQPINQMNQASKQFSNHQAFIQSTKHTSIHETVNPSHPIPSHAMPCHIMPYHAMPYHACRHAYIHERTYLGTWIYRYEHIRTVRHHHSCNCSPSLLPALNSTTLADLAALCQKLYRCNIAALSIRIGLWFGSYFTIIT